MDFFGGFYLCALGLETKLIKNRFQGFIGLDKFQQKISDFEMVSYFIYLYIDKKKILGFWEILGL